MSAEEAAKDLDRAIANIAPYHSSLFWGDRMLTLDKSVSFRKDPRFKAAIAAADSKTGTNQYESPDGISWRFNTLIWAAKQALHVDGDFVECGVYEGDMSWVLTEMVDLRGKHMYLYDTFSGFSEKYSSAADYPDSPRFFDLAQADYSRSEIYNRVLNRFSRKPYVSVIKGTVPDILSELSPQRIAFLHLDMNAPTAERLALEALYDRISAGGVIVFDDYGWSIFRKQRDEADAFLMKQNLAILELPTGQGLAIKPPL
jgi:hypothetical protein